MIKFNPLTRVLKTTTLKLMALYLLLVTISFGALTYWLIYNTKLLLENQLTNSITREQNELINIAGTEGLAALVQAINARITGPSPNIYMLTNYNGNPIIGNIYYLPPEILINKGMHELSYRKINTNEMSIATVKVAILANGLRLLIGYDRSEVSKFDSIVQRIFITSLAILAIITLIGIVIATRMVLARVNAIAKTSRQIIGGDLSKRMPVTSSGDEFDRLSTILNMMLDRIERLMHGFKETSDNIAHDLKTPLARIRAKAETSLGNASSQAEYKKTLRSIIADADNLIKTFNALLTITRADAGNADLDAIVNIKSLLNDIIELYEPLAEESNITIISDCQADIHLQSNRELLAMAIANLLDNAIKYGAGAEKPLINITGKRSKNEVIITVADNGNGIPEAMHNKVKKRFARLDSSRSQPGSGLGLSLVAAIAKLHNGRFELANNNPGLAARIILEYKPQVNKVNPEL